MEQKTYTQQLFKLRETIIEEIKSYLNRNIGDATLDIKENPVMCNTLCGGFFIAKVSIFGVQVNQHGSLSNHVLDELSTDDLRRIHSLLVTGNENI